MHLLRHALLSALWCILASSAWAQDPLFRRFTMREGMPSNTIYTVLQDRDGHLWFGTDAGAVRFDGQRMDLFNLQNGLPDDDVFVIDSDRRGRVWFLTGNGMPGYLDRGVLHTWRTDSVLAKVVLRSGIRSMYEDSTGTLWFGGLKGELVTLSPKGEVRNLSVLDPASRTPGGHITIGPDEKGEPLVFSNAMLVDLSAGPSPIKRDTSGVLNITRVCPNGQILSISPTRVRTWHEGRWDTLFSASELVGEAQFVQAYQLGEREIWVTLKTGGVLWLKYDGERWRPLREVLFQSDLINNMVRDREGNIWLCTDFGGVIMFTEQAESTSFFRGQRGTREEFTRAHVDGSGNVWCGTNQGDLYRLRSKLELLELPPEGGIFVRVNALRSHGNTLWTSTSQHVFRLDLGTEPPRVEDVISDHRIWDKPRYAGMKALTIGRDGRVIGTMYGAFQLDPESDRMVGIDDPAIPDLRIYAPHLDDRGTLWFEEQGLLFSRTASGVRPHPEVDLPPGIHITDITSQGDTLFVATSGAGVLVLTNGRVVHHIRAGDGLSSDHVHHLQFDGGDLFVASDRGGDRVSGPWKAPRVLQYANASGRRSSSVRDVVADSAHTYVLFADGLCRMPRTLPPQRPQVPQPYIRTVMVNDSALAERTIVGIRQRKDRLILELGAIHFTNPDQVRLEYHLDPEAAWLPMLGNTIDLSTLDAGDHVLQVRARLIGGPWSDPVSMTLVVVPPLWNRWWAISLMVLAGSITVIMVLNGLIRRRYRARIERVRQREILATERQRIAMDLHDDLGAELSSLLLLTRMERERPATGGLERIETLAGKLTDKVKEVIWSTDPGHDTVEGTLTFIQRYVSTMCERHGLRARTIIPPLLPHLVLTAGARRELYLIAKEAVNNAVKHAQASTFTFSAAVERGVLEIAFADDGRGGATHPVEAGGNGLRNMRGRAEALGATLVVSEADPQGTRVSLRLPIDKGRPNG